MSYLMPDNQTEASASREDVPGEIDATDIHSPSTNLTRREQDNRDITVGILDEAELPERNLLNLTIAAALLPLLLCRLWCSILAASISLLRRQVSDVVARLMTVRANQQYESGTHPSSETAHTIEVNSHHESGTNPSSEATSDVAQGAAKTELYLREALRASQDALDQFIASQRDGDLNGAIEGWKNVLALCPIDHEVRSLILGSLGNLLRTRFDRGGDMGDLEEGIRHHQEAVTLCPIGHPDRASTLNNLGNGLDTRFGRTGIMADLEESIRLYEEALTLCPISHPARASTLNNLGYGLERLFARTGNMADIEKSIRHYKEALNLRSIGHPDRTSTLDNLGNQLYVRFGWTGNMGDLEEGICHHKETLTLRPIGHSERALALSNVGNGLYIRFGQTGNMADLEESIHLHKAALTLRPIGHPERASTLVSLGNGFYSRFGRAGNIVDLEEGIRHYQDAITLCPIGHPHRVLVLNNLGNGLEIRFEQKGNITDLEESTRYRKEALTLHPIGHPARALTLNNLGAGLNRRFGQTGNMADLEESIRHLEEALTLYPIGHPDRVSILKNLGNGLDMRFGRTGNMTDLEEGIRHHKEALTLRPIGHPDRASTLYILSNGLDARFGRTGNLADLDESIRHNREAVALCPIGHPGQASILGSLGNQLNRRFGQMGNMADLEESIRHNREALALCPIGHSYRASTLHNLGNGLETRFGRTGTMADLEDSIRCYEEALSLCPIGHYDRALALNNIGTGLSRRFEQTGNIGDLEESIRYHQEALTLRLDDHPDRASTLSNIGTGLSMRFGRTGNMADLEGAIRHYHEALALCPPGVSAHAVTLNNLGVGLRRRFECTGSIANLKESIQHFMDAAGHSLSRLSHRLAGASNWVKTAHDNGLESIEDAYSIYMDIFDRSLLLPASSILDTYAHIVHLRRDMVHVTEDATSHAIQKQRPRKAVEIAERGRALLFTQLGNYRTPLNDLEAANKDLANRFLTLSTELDHSATSLLDSMATLPAPGDQVARRQQMVVDWDHTLAEIRQLDGFRDFLGVTPFANLQKAAADGPVILVNISQDGSYALIITATREPLSIPLPEATPDAVVVLANTLLKNTRGDDGPEANQRLVGFLRDLWAMIVAPVVLQLETLLCLPLGSRIWWMSTSEASWFPLHAAGPYKSGEKNLSDRFLSSYTTTLSSLIRSREGYQPVKRVSGPRMLVVAQAEAEGQDILPNVEAEVALIRQLGTAVTIIEGEDCTRDAVLAGLKDMTWVHFSCHGHQHSTEPFKSHFSLRKADAPLTLLDIIQNGLPRAELAVLSACHSASGDISAPNEAVNLAAGVMFAGFRSAVGTMWAMHDEDGPVIAEHFYKYMFRNGLEAVDCRDAAKAMVMGVRELRRRKVPLARWINFVHYGI
ncbi:hypothetical protein FRB95_004722 [Tulasnella sp. JGI-2019a]|nr:hypothetical protein FRB95_004722 [Tulasnella sp. JGI-2019a]